MSSSSPQHQAGYALVEARYGPCLGCSGHMDLVIEMKRSPGKCWWMPASFSSSEKPFLSCKYCWFQADTVAYQTFQEMLLRSSCCTVKHTPSVPDLEHDEDTETETEASASLSVIPEEIPEMDDRSWANSSLSSTDLLESQASMHSEEDPSIMAH